MSIVVLTHPGAPRTKMTVDGLSMARRLQKPGKFESPTGTLIRDQGSQSREHKKIQADDPPTSVLHNSAEALPKCCVYARSGKYVVV